MEYEQITGCRYAPRLTYFPWLIIKICVQPAQGFFFANQCQRIVQLRAERRPGDGDADETEEDAGLLTSYFQQFV